MNISLRRCRRALMALAALSFATVPAIAQSPQPGWIPDARTGCRLWTPAPQPNVTVTWSGACVSGLASGRGIVQWYLSGKPNTRYEGEYRDGKMNGRGIATSVNGDRYEGDLRDNKKNGRGVYMSANGDCYEGDWRDNKSNGRGVVTWAGGSRYEGEFRDGKPHGLGRYTKPDGFVANGVWTDGCFSDGSGKRAALGREIETCPR